MKKLSIIVAAGCLALATPVFACPGHDSGGDEVKTAEKAKEEPKKEEPKKEEAPKAKEGTTTAKATDKAKQAPKKDAPAKPTKVSQK
ncbi:MAG TPA: hypothetical protein VL326_38780 [Kofleriaceae bacterium]|jgi:hypothetical protein|nr:hypothetical protein [Kofleriaceae bacterium]